MRVTISTIRFCAWTVVLTAVMCGNLLWAQEPPAKKPDMIVATDYPDLNAAVDAARKLHVGRLYIPSGVYPVNKTLNLTDWAWLNPPETKPAPDMPARQPASLIIEGAGSSTVLVGNTGKDPVIDLTGSSRMILRDFNLQTPQVNGKSQPGGSVGILMARKAANEGAVSAGHHSFSYLSIAGNYSTAAAMSFCSEENTYDHCMFINEGGDAFIFTGENKEGVTSPYQQLQSSSNVVATFYFGWFWTGKKDSVGLRISCGGEVYLYGGFFATYGESFSAIYLDGTRGCSNIRLSSVRQEGISGHSIYAVGSVYNVMLDSCTLQSNDAEVVHYEETVPNTEGPHRFVSRPEWRSRASNWTITGSTLARSFRADPAAKYDSAKPVLEGFSTLRFESLQDSRFQNNIFYTLRGTPDVENYSWPKQKVDTDGPLVVVEQYSRRNCFELPSREALDLRGDAKSNTVTALADDLEEKVPPTWRGEHSPEVPGFQGYYDGRRRTYVDPDASGSLMNLGLTDVYKMSKPRKGDMAMHDGTGFPDHRARLALFDGANWVFFVPEAAAK